MKVLKYIIYVLFITIAMVFTCEMYLLNLDCFETEYIRTTMYLPSDISTEEMIGDIEEEASQNNLKVFTVVRNLESSYQTEIIVYGMEGVGEILKEQSNISEGEFHSILVGDTTVRFENFDDVPDLDTVDTFYIIGTMENARIFKSELIDKYNGDFPNEGYTYLHAVRNMLAIWTIGFLFFTLISIFEVSVIKKESTLRVIFGSSLYPVIMKNILSDLTFYISVFLVGHIVIRRQFGIRSEFHSMITVYALCVICIADICAFLSLNHTNYKRNLSRAGGGKSMIATGYAFRSVISAIIVFSMTVFISMISQYAVYKSEENFFTELCEYSYVSVVAGDQTLESSEDAMESFFALQEEQGNVFLNVYLDNGMFTGKPCLMFNSGSENYLKEKIPELENSETKGKLIFLVPEAYQNEGVSDLEFLSQMYLYEDIDYEVIAYSKNVSVIGMTRNDNITGSYYRNPLIILDETGVSNYYNGMYILQSAHVKVTDSGWDDFVSEYNLYEKMSNKTNALANYQRLLSGYKRTALMAVAVFLLISILNIVITWTVVKFICTENAMEIAVKTAIGYSVPAKYKMLFFLNLFTIIINGIFCICIGISLSSSVWMYMLIGIILVLIFDWIVTLFSIGRWEKRNLVKVLKGAVL